MKYWLQKDIREEVLLTKLNMEPLHDEVKNNEDVRIFRLHLLEENQVKILRKIEELEEKLDENYNEKIKDLEKRIALLEECCKNYTKFKWVIIVEAIAIIGFIFKSSLGV